MQTTVGETKTTIELTHEEYLGFIDALEKIKHLIKTRKEGNIIHVEKPAMEILQRFYESLNLSLFE